MNVNDSREETRTEGVRKAALIPPGGVADEGSVLPGAVRTFLLNEIREELHEVSPDASVPPTIDMTPHARKTMAISPPIFENEPVADMPPLPPAPADVPPTPESIRFFDTPFSQPPRPHDTEYVYPSSGRQVVQSPTYTRTQMSPRVAALSSPGQSPMSSYNRVVALNLPASNRPISPHSNVATRWSEQRRSGSSISGGYASPSHYVRYSSQPSSESVSSSPRIAAAVAAARASPSPSLNYVPPKEIVSSRGSSLGSRMSLPHSPKLKSPRGEDPVNNPEDEVVSHASTPGSLEMLSRLRPILFAAVRHNKFETVEKLIADLPELVDITDENNKDNSLLHMACSNGYARIARFLIRSGINVDATNSDGNTPLHFCYMFGRNQLVSILISHNANENARNRKDQIPAQLLSAS